MWQLPECTFRSQWVRLNQAIVNVFKRLSTTHSALTVFHCRLIAIFRYDCSFAVCLVYLRPCPEERLQSKEGRSSVSSVLGTASPEAPGTLCGTLHFEGYHLRDGGHAPPQAELENFCCQSLIESSTICVLYKKSKREPDCTHQPASNNTLKNSAIDAMKVSMLSLIAIVGLTAASPVTLDVRADRGSYTVSGLGGRKQQVLNAGGDSLDLAIAMLETDNMSTNYAYGDGKTQDAANFGIFKQNWGMLRECASRAGFKGQSQANWNNGAKLK